MTSEPPADTRPALLYDPDCGFCTAAATRMARWGLGTRIEPMSPGWATHDGLDADRATREIPFVPTDGPVSYGADAIAAALATGPMPWRLVGTVIGRPPVLWLARAVYRWVARHRHQLPGGTAACRMPPAQG